MEPKSGNTPSDVFNPGKEALPSPESPKGGFRVEVRQPEMLYLIAKEGINTKDRNFFDVEVSSTGIQNDILMSEKTRLGGNKNGTFAYSTSVRLSDSRISREDRGYYDYEKVRRINQILSQLGYNAMFDSTRVTGYDSTGEGFIRIVKDGYYIDVNFGFPNHESYVKDVGRSVPSAKRLAEKMRGNSKIDITLLDKNIAPYTSTYPQLKNEGDFLRATNAYAEVYEQVIKAIYAEEGKVSPAVSVILRPPIANQDTLTQLKSTETQHPITITKEQVKTEMGGFDEIAGQDAAVSEAKRLVLAINHPEVFEKRGVKRPKGILFYGPPGTGKTIISQAVAKEANADFLQVSAADIGTKWYGESERLMQQVFDTANGAVARGRKVILFFDEIDALAPSREDVHEATRKVVATLLQNVDGMKANPNVTVLAATNRPQDIDPALRRSGRFDKLIYVGLPESKGREAILKVHMEKAKKAATQAEELFSPDIDLEHLGRVTDGMSGADLANLVNLTLEEKTMAELEGKPWTPVATEEMINTAKRLNMLKEEKRKMGFALPNKEEKPDN